MKSKKTETHRTAHDFDGVGETALSNVTASNGDSWLPSADDGFGFDATR